MYVGRGTQDVTVSAGADRKGIQMSKIENQAIFEDMPIPKAARRLMLPTVMSSLVMVIYSLADTYFVGMLNDPVQNAAVALAAPVLLAFNAVNNLFGVGSSSMMSRGLGRKDFDTASDLIRIFIENSEIVRYGTMFLRALCFSITFLVIDFLGVGVFQGIGKGKISLVFALLRKLALEIPATLLLDRLFGVNGIVYGAFAAEVILACVSTVILTRLVKKLQEGS